MFNSSDKLANLNLPFFNRRAKEQVLCANAHSKLSMSLSKSLGLDHIKSQSSDRNIKFVLSGSIYLCSED